MTARVAAVQGGIEAGSRPDAVVLSCLGGSQGDLGVVRTLDRWLVRLRPQLFGYQFLYELVPTGRGDQRSETPSS